MPNNKDFAIVIGIEDYVTLKRLQGPVNDANDFYNWLISSSGGDLPSSNAHLILSSSNPVTPLQDDIDDKINLINQAGHIEGFNRFYFYFAGHGYGKDWKENGLCLPKWSSFFRNYALSSASYLDGIINIGVFKQVFFFLDCCRDKIFSVNPLPPTFGGPVASNIAESFVAYAAEFDNPAYEAMALNSFGGNLVRGHFTKALVTGLSGGAINEAGHVTTDSIKGYLKTTVEDMANKNNQTQTVRFNDAFTVPATISSPFVTSIDVKIYFSIAGYYILEDSHTHILYEGDSTTGPWTLNLYKGLYALRNITSNEDRFLRIDHISNPFTYEFK